MYFIPRLLKFLLHGLLLRFVHSVPSIEHHPVPHEGLSYYAVRFRPPSETGHEVFPAPLMPWPRVERDRHWKRHYDQLAQQLLFEQPSLQLLGQIDVGHGHYLYAIPRHGDVMQWLFQHPYLRWIEEQVPRQRHRKRMDKASLENILHQLQIEDPGIGSQWHLANLMNPGQDTNVTGVWLQGVTGQHVVTAVIDDGVDMNHEDLRENFFLQGSYDYNLKRKAPIPMTTDDMHGTRCAGEIAAVPNSYCGVGIAYRAKVAGIRILGGPITDVDEALALNYGMDVNHIYSCSWGPPDDGRTVDGPNPLVLTAMINGIKKGRQGRGSLFVFATGNGGYYDDNCNYDGYTNSIYTISIGAIDVNNNHPAYSEKCSAHLGVTYSSGSGQAIYTTNPLLFRQNCTADHGGTSAAAPLVVGMLALALSVRPDLDWRDAQHVVLRAAVPFHLNLNNEWQTVSGGRSYSHKFGYGRIDGYRLVEEARQWKKVGPQVSLRSYVQRVQQSIPFGKNGLSSTINITENMIDRAFLQRLEHVTVTVSITHMCRGDLDIYLISPNGIISHLGPRRSYDDSTEGFKNWTFMSVKHWEESMAGPWRLKVIDSVQPEQVGTLEHWWIKFWGEASPAFNTSTPPSTGDNSGEDHHSDKTEQHEYVPPESVDWYESLALSAGGVLLILLVTIASLAGIVFVYVRYVRHLPLSSQGFQVVPQPPPYDENTIQLERLEGGFELEEQSPVSNVVRSQ